MVRVGGVATQNVDDFQRARNKREYAGQFAEKMGNFGENPATVRTGDLWVVERWLSKPDSRKEEAVSADIYLSRRIVCR